MPDESVGLNIPNFGRSLDAILENKHDCISRAWAMTAGDKELRQHFRELIFGKAHLYTPELLGKLLSTNVDQSQMDRINILCSYNRLSTADEARTVFLLPMLTHSPEYINETVTRVCKAKDYNILHHMVSLNVVDTATVMEQCAAGTLDMLTFASPICKQYKALTLPEINKVYLKAFQNDNELILFYLNENVAKCPMVLETDYKSEIVSAVGMSTWMGHYTFMIHLHTVLLYPVAVAQFGEFIQSPNVQCINYYFDRCGKELMDSMLFPRGDLAIPGKRYRGNLQSTQHFVQYMLTKMPVGSEENLYSLLMFLCRELFARTCCVDKSMTNFKEEQGDLLKYLMQIYDSMSEACTQHVRRTRGTGNILVIPPLLDSNETLNKILESSTFVKEVMEYIIKSSGLMRDISHLTIDVSYCFKCEGLFDMLKESPMAPSISSIPQNEEHYLNRYTPSEIMNVGQLVADGTISSNQLSMYCQNAMTMNNLSIRNIIALDILKRASELPDLGHLFHKVLELPPTSANGLL